MTAVTWSMGLSVQLFIVTGTSPLQDAQLASQPCLKTVVAVPQLLNVPNTVALLNSFANPMHVLHTKDAGPSFWLVEHMPVPALMLNNVASRHFSKLATQAYVTPPLHSF
jgi:hypothetical protein